MYDYIIVGTGLFGSICAYELNKKGKKVLVLDKRNHIGGNIYTELKEGINVHKYGPHIFHTSNKEVWNYINQFGEFNNFINMPIARYKDEIYNLPFNMNTFSRIWSDVYTPEDAKKHIEEEKFKGEPTNLEEQAMSLVGETIYKKLVKEYTEKQWGKDCKDLPTFIIKRLPVRYTYNNNYFNDTYQGIPKEGYTKLIERMLEGIEVRLNTDFLDDKEYYKKISNKIIYTGTIDGYYNYCYGNLEYRSLRFKEEILDTDNWQGSAIVNWTSKDVPYTRIIEHKHFNNDISDKTIITYEYPVKNDLEPYYPINNENNDSLYQKYKKLAETSKNVFFGGRLGSYKYYDMDKTIEEALKLIEELEK